MTASITVDATLRPDGLTLELERKLPIAPGRVTVTLQPAAPTSAASMLEVLERIHRERAQRGRPPMGHDEMAAEIARIRAEDEDYENRWREIWSNTDRSESTPDAS